MINKLLLWEKWRPKNIDDMVLLPRIKKNFKNGIDGNYIFYGTYGTGKTSLARILIGKYTKDKPYIEINSSLYTSIDVLRNEIEDFCKFTPMIQSENGIKYVFLDEFERVSIQFQDAFKAFIERYSKSGVRFIITTNHISKISDGIKSRIPQINFDAQSIDEEKFLKKQIFSKIVNEILPGENYSIKKENVAKIVTKKYPDFRSTIEEIQNYIRTDGSTTESLNVSNQIKLKLYDIIYDKNISYEDIYHFLMNNFGPEKIDILIKFLGKSFIDWSIENSKNVDDLFECNFVISDYSTKLDNSIDPIVLGLTIIGKFRNILIKDI